MLINKTKDDDLVHRQGIKIKKNEGQTIQVSIENPTARKDELRKYKFYSILALNFHSLLDDLP